MRKTRIAIGLAAAAALLAALPGSASASPSAAGPPSVGTFKTSTNDVPSTVKRGSTVELVTWYQEKSPDKLVPQGYGLDLWNTSSSIKSDSRGVTVSWQDPLTGRWVKTPATYNGESYSFGIEKDSKFLVNPSGYIAHINVRISFASDAYAGTWHIMPTPVDGYGLMNSKGTFLDAILRFGTWPVYAFRVR